MLAPLLTAYAIPGLPLISPGDDLAVLIGDAMEQAAFAPHDGDILVLTSKALSRAENRFVDLQAVTPSAHAQALAAEIGHDPRLVELILRESSAISRKAPGVLIVRHRLGHISANAGIDASNAVPKDAPPQSGPWVLLLPEDPDRSADSLRIALSRRFGAEIGVVISDSLGRPFRVGSVGAAVGLAGVPALNDFRGQQDLCGRALVYTMTAFADQIAAVADLVAGQAGEGRAAILVRGAAAKAVHTAVGTSAKALLRPADKDLYA